MTNLMRRREWFAAGMGLLATLGTDGCSANRRRRRLVRRERTHWADV